MRMKGSNYSYHGQKIYIGLDVHLRSWSVAILTSSGYKEQFSQESRVDILHAHLLKKYPGGEYYSVYESGFSGFSTHYQLESYGIHNMVTHASDVPSSQKERIYKTDKRDAFRLARSLREGNLDKVYVLSPQELAFREQVRYRQRLVSDTSQWKNRIKSYLYRNGISYPDSQKICKHWSCKFVSWLEEVGSLAGNEVLPAYVNSYKEHKQAVLSMNKQLHIFSKEEIRSKEMDLLQSIPGIGFYTAITFLSEMGNISRFKNEKEFAAFIGIVPLCHDTGDKKSTAGITFRGNKQIRCLLIEASWIAIRFDPALGACFGKLILRMKPNVAIIRIGRKLSNRILSVLKTGKKYMNENNSQ